MEQLRSIVEQVSSQIGPDAVLNWVIVITVFGGAFLILERDSRYFYMPAAVGLLVHLTAVVWSPSEHAKILDAKWVRR